MITKLLLFSLALSSSRGQQFGPPCGSIWKIVNCVCDDPAETEVKFPWMCRRENTIPSKCDCKDGSEWNPPHGPCEDGSRDVIDCEFNEETSSVVCYCADLHFDKRM